MAVVFDLVATGAPEGVVVLTVTGEIDMANAPRLRSELVRACTEGDGPPRIVIDLVGADLLDSTGIAAILEGVKRCALRGGDLALARAEPQVRRELELTRVAAILPIHATVDAAVAAVLGT